MDDLAQRLVREFATSGMMVGEALLTLADFLIVLREVDYRGDDGALTKAEFDQVFFPFVAELAETIRIGVEPQHERVSEDQLQFWKRVLEQCRS